MRRVKLYVMLLFTIGVVSSFIQNNEEQAIKELSEITSVFNKGVYYLKFRQEVYLKEQQVNAITSEMWIDGQKFKYLTPYLNIYGDGKNIVTVVKENNMIMIQSMPEETKQEETIPTAGLGFDHLKSISKSVRSTVNKGVRTLRFVYTDDVQKKDKIISTSIQFNPKAKKIMSVESVRMENEQEVTEIYHYDTIALNFKAGELTNDVVNRVLQGDKIRPEYKQFTVQDYRNR